MIKLEDTPKARIDSRWYRDVEDHDYFRKQLLSQTMIWDQMIRVLKELYRNSNDNEFDLEKPNIHERMLYNEGYKKAIVDIYKLIPTKGETNPS